MKKVLLSTCIAMTMGISSGYAQEAEAPAFPETLDVAVSNEGINIWQGAVENLLEGTLTEDEAELAFGMYPASAIVLTGETSDKSETLSFTLPNGWTGVLPIKIKLNGLGEGWLKTRSNPSDWMIVDEIKANYGMMGLFDTTIPEGTKIDFTMEEKQIFLCYLYTDMEMDGEKYSLADIANSFLVIVNPKEEGVETDALEFPTSMTVTADCETVEIEEMPADEEEGTPLTYVVSGTSTENAVTLTFEIPEGWGGMIGMLMPMGDYMKKVPAEWPTIEDFTAEGYEIAEDGKIVIPADGAMYMGMYFLYADGKVDPEHGIMISATIGNEGGLAFPEEFDFTSSVEANQVSFAQLSETDEYVKAFVEVCEENYLTNINTCETAIVLSGKTTDMNANLSFELPEGWTDVVAFKYDPSLVPPMDDENNEYRKVAPFEPGMPEWLGLPAWLVPMEEATDFQFAVGEKQLYFCYLATDYADEWGEYHVVDIANSFIILVDVESKGSGVESIESAGNIRYYDLQGRKISKPGKGAFIKVEGGKATKGILK